MLERTVRVQRSEHSLDSSSDFDIFLDLAAALAIVLTLPGRTISTIKLPPLITRLNFDSAQSKKDHYYDKLLERLNSCTTLSCSQKGINGAVKRAVS